MAINFKKFSVKKTKDMDLKKATERAMKQMQTFESNLDVEETETHFVFRKKRG